MGLNKIFVNIDFHVYFMVMGNEGPGIILRLAVFEIFTQYMFIYFQNIKCKYIPMCTFVCCYERLWCWSSQQPSQYRFKSCCMAVA